jgi:hypothetical protein
MHHPSTEEIDTELLLGVGRMKRKSGGELGLARHSLQKNPLHGV